MLEFPAAGRAAALLPPVLGLAGVLSSGLAGWPAAALALLCGARVLQLLLPCWTARRGQPVAGTRHAVCVDLAASGVLCWRAADGAALAQVARDSRIAAWGLGLAGAGAQRLCVAAATAPRAQRALARQLLRRRGEARRWQPQLPAPAQRGKRARIGYNRVLRVHRSAPCPPS